MYVYLSPGTRSGGFLYKRAKREKKKSILNKKKKSQKEKKKGRKKKNDGGWARARQVAPSLRAYLRVSAFAGMVDQGVRSACFPLWPLSPSGSAA
jgi:hypothetical protein